MSGSSAISDQNFLAPCRKVTGEEKVLSQKHLAYIPLQLHILWFNSLSKNDFFFKFCISAA